MVYRTLIKCMQDRDVLLNKLESINQSDNDLSKLSNDELKQLYKDLTASFYVDYESYSNDCKKTKIAKAMLFLGIESIDSDGMFPYICKRKERKDKPYFRVNERW